jgi:hypothetical protein
MSLERPRWSMEAERIFRQIKVTESDHLYVIQSEHKGAVKVGRSTRPERRLSQLQTASPAPLRLIRVYWYHGHREHVIHRMLAPLRLTGEWFQPSAMLILDEVMP